MAPSRHGLLVLLGFIASIQAVPAPVPEPDIPVPRQVGTLLPPSYSMSWENPVPAPTEDPEPENPEDPEDPMLPTLPVPSNRISLSPPSFSVSWDPPLHPTHSKTKKPWRPTEKTTTKPGVSATISWGRRQEGEELEPTIISLSPPSYSISWDPPLSPTHSKTKKPWPTNSTTTEPTVSATVSWGKRQEDEEPEPTYIPLPSNGISLSPPSYSISWDPPLPPTHTKTKKPRPTKKTTTKPGVSATISWGKRQEDEDPEPTDVPEPEDPGDGPIEIPPTFPTPGNSIGIQPPQVSFSWGKRDDATYPTETYPPPTWWLGNPTASISWPKPPKHTSGYISWGKRQDEGGPTDVIPPIPEPSDEISINPPTVSMSWGKRDDAEYPTETYPPPTWWLGDPTASLWWPKPPKQTSAYISWGKRQDGEETTTDLPTLPTAPNEISINPPTASISWGKRDNAEYPTESYPPPTWWLGNPTASIWWPKPPKHTSGYISWDRRDGVPPPTYGIVWPTNLPSPTWDFSAPVQSGPGYISWGKRDAAPETTAPAELPKAEVPQYTCSLTKTVTHPIFCPMIACPAICRTIYGTDNNNVNARDEPSAHPTLSCPVTVTVTGKCPTCQCPSTLITQKPTPTKPTPVCPTVTRTIVPPCVPPVCPQSLVACDATPAEKLEEVKVREIEKTIVTVKTITPPTGASTPIIDKCTPVPTRTVYEGCPTYTCVPEGDCPATMRI